MKVKVKLAPGAKLPEYKTKGAACADIYSNENVTFGPGVVTGISTGLFVEIPEGYEILIRPRSGLSSNYILVANSPGTIDCDYRGEIKVLLYNTSDNYADVKHGDRIAQMTIKKVEQIEWDVTEELSETERGEGGFGHTGK